MIDFSNEKYLMIDDERISWSDIMKWQVIIVGKRMNLILKDGRKYKCRYYVKQRIWKVV